MKKYVEIMLVTLLSMSIISCKKSSTSKDYVASVKNRVWWGELAYTGKPPEYYSVHFNADNTLTWSQLLGDYPGRWIINNKQLTITFIGSSTEIKADISDDDKLMNITDNTSSSEIISGQLVANPNITLSGTRWKGNCVMPMYQTIDLVFLNGSQVGISIGLAQPSDPYSRSTSGGVIRTTYMGITSVFGVIISGSEMKGSIGDAAHPWNAIKQ